MSIRKYLLNNSKFVLTVYILLEKNLKTLPARLASGLYLVYNLSWGEKHAFLPTPPPMFHHSISTS